MEPIAIRPAAPGDVDIIVRFNMEMAQESEGLGLSPGTLRRGVEASLGDPGLGKYFLAEKGGKVAGQIRVTREWSDWNNGFYWWIQNVYVPPPERRRGIYAALHAHVRGLARETGACGLLLYVDRENAPARDVYRRLGMDQSHYLIYEQEEIRGNT
ncbi:MAG: GNAT family N-acetyltransferase [bacterium]